MRKKKRLRIPLPDFTSQRTAKIATVLAISFALFFSAIASSAFVPRQVEAATPSKLTVNAVALDGKVLHMWTVVASGGKNLFSGWTPFTYTGEVGKTYTVTAYDWSGGKLYFDHWQDGSKDRRKIVTLSGTAMTLKSYYNYGAITVPTTGTLKINAIASDGKSVNMWTTIWSGNTLVSTGFTPFTFTGTYGKTYTVNMANYGDLVFDHWTDGSKNDPRTFTLYQSTSFTAYYNTDQTEPEPTGLPTISITSPTGGQVLTSASHTVTGTAADNVGVAKVEVSLDGGAYSLANGGTTWSFNLSGLSSGPHTLTARASDAAGNSGSASRSFSVDITPPSILISSPAGGQVLTSASHTVTGTAADNVGVAKVEVSLNGGAYTLVGGSQSWSISLSELSGGAHSLTARASDAVGNTQTATVGFSVSIAPTPDPEPTTGAYVPLYMYPGGTGWTHWQKVIDAKNAHPSVPVVTSINPSSGVGSSKNTAFVNGITKLKAADITVIGYVYTDYGSRDINAIKSEISKYKDWYNVDGIMFDEMSNSAGKIEYYRQLDDYAKSIGMTYTKGNPGADIAEGYIGTLDNFSIRETTSLGSLSSLAGWHTEYDKSNFSFCVYAQPSLNTTYVKDSAKYVSLMYITNDSGGNPYDTVPPYFEQMLATLEQVS
jgi:hypothetical protein